MDTFGVVKVPRFRKKLCDPGGDDTGRYELVSQKSVTGAKKGDSNTKP